MSKPFDAITRTLLESHPDDWLALFGLGRGLPVRVVDSDVSTVTAEADKVLRVDAPEPYLVHVEVQTGYDPALPRRLLRYNALLDVRHDLPVHSVAVLLWPEADGKAITGTYARESPGGGCRVDFSYPVVRVWEVSVDDLAAGPGTLPLAALAARTEGELERVAVPALAAFHDPPTQDERELRAALYFLTGRQFGLSLAKRILRGDPAMEKSETYQLVVREGQIKEGRRIVLRQATTRFGPPDDAARTRLEAMTDLDRLEALADRVLTAADWDTLFADEVTG